MPWSTCRANVDRMARATSGRPVASVSPGSEIIVSRPQSLNHGYPAITVRPCGSNMFARSTTNASAASTSRRTQSGASRAATGCACLQASSRPFSCARRRAVHSERPRRGGACERLPPQSAGDGLDLGLAVAARRGGVRIAMIDHRLEREAQRAGCADQMVLDIRRVLALLHPDPPLEPDVPDRPYPHRDRLLEAERFEVQVPGGARGAARPVVRVELDD